MSIARRLLGLKAAKTQIKAPDFMLRTAEHERYDVPALELPKAQAELYQRLLALATAVDTVANYGTTAALQVERRSGEETVAVPNHPFELLLQNPNPLDARSELLFGTFAYRALTGNAYWYLNRAGPDEPPAEIWLVPSWSVRPVPDGKSYLAGYEYDDGSGVLEVRPVWQFCHFRRFHPRNRYVGMSLIEALAIDAEAEMAMSRWNRNYFDKDNAKVPGALAFSDFVADDSWERIKADAKAGWGGTQRSGPMMLRGSGAGGVQWVAMALSQSDMEFLAGRQFIKEQVWSGFAPGLASMLAINANEANARTGKSVLVEMAVWPMLTTIAEKITQGILPAYGREFVATFEDIRITDRAMQLQEQAAYAQVHTVDEIRAKHYADKPLGDPRGDLLPAQVGPTTPGPGMAELQPEPKEPEPEEEPVQPGQPEESEREDGTDRRMQEEWETGREEVDEAGESRKALAQWQTKALGRLRRGKAAACEFESEAIPPALNAAIAGALEACATPDAVKAVFADVWQDYP